MEMMREKNGQKKREENEMKNETNTLIWRVVDFQFSANTVISFQFFYVFFLSFFFGTNSFRSNSCKRVKFKQFLRPGAFAHNIQ